MANDGRSPNPFAKKDLLYMEEPLHMGEQFTKLFEKTKNLELKEVLAKEMLEKLTLIEQRNQSIHDLYDVAETFDLSGNLLEKNEMPLAMDFFRKSLDTWKKIEASSQIIGKFSEKAQVHLNIARIYGEKFYDTPNERVHIQRATQSFLQELELMRSIGNLPKMAQLYSTIGELFVRLDEVPRALENIQAASIIAKEIEYTRLVFNTAEIQAILNRKLGDDERATNVLNETIEFLLEKIPSIKKNQNELQSAEIYQFVKKLYFLLGEQKESILYSKKEANQYIALAKTRQKEGLLNESAALYRGAALCFREINLHIDAGSCFHLAGNLQRNAKSYASAAESFVDSAHEFEKAKNLEKSAELLTLAADSFIENKHFDAAVDAFSCAFDLLEGTPGTENSAIKSQLGHKTAIILSQVAQMRAEEHKYALAGTLFLEAAVFLRRVNADWTMFLVPQIRQSMVNFQYAFNTGLKGKPIEDSVAFWSIETALGAWLVGNSELPEEIYYKVMMTSNFPYQEEVVELLRAFTTSIEEHTHDVFSRISNKTRNIFEGSPEIKKLSLFLEEKIQELPYNS